MKRKADEAGIGGDEVGGDKAVSGITKSYPPLDSISFLVKKDAVTHKLRKQVINMAFNKDDALWADADRLPGPLPHPVYRKHIIKIQQEPDKYWVTVKMDGMRFMLWVTKRGCYLIDREFHFRKLSTGQFYIDKFCHKQGDTLLDGELIWEDHVQGGNMKYMVFDCVVWMGDSQIDHPLSVRLEKIQEMDRLCLAHPDLRDATMLPAFAKRMVGAKFTTDLFKRLEIMPSGDGYCYRDDNSDSAVQTGSPVTQFTTMADGLVFMREDDECGYHFKPQGSLLKWKLIHTVDMMAHIKDARPSDVDGNVLMPINDCLHHPSTIFCHAYIPEFIIRILQARCWSTCTTTTRISVRRSTLQMQKWIQVCGKK